MPADFGLIAEIQLQMGAQANAVLGKIRSDIEKNLTFQTTGAVTAFDNLTKASTRAHQATSNFNTLSRSTLASIDATTKSVKHATGSLEEFAKMSGLAIRRYSGFVLTTSATFGMLRAMGGAIKDAIEFEKQMVRIAQTSEGTLASVASVGKEISRIAIKWGADSKELANVGVILAQAGYSATETQSMLEALGKTTLAATFGNISQTTEGLIAILNQFNLKASDTERILSEVNIVAAKYAVESEDIIEGVKRGGAAFAAAGGNLEEFMALFTSVRQTTRESAESIATGMRTIFTRLQRGSTIAMLEELGIKLRDLNGQFIGPMNAIREINRVMAQVPPTSGLFAAVTEEIGGYRQMSKTIPLIQQLTLAEQVLNDARAGGNSLTKDAMLAQEALWVQIKKVKEEFLALFRGISQDETFKGFIQLILKATSAIIAMAEAIRPILPLLAIAGIAKAASFLSVRGPALGQAFLQPWKGHSGGGFINSGGGSVDDVPAMLTKGEYVLKKSAVSAIGIGTLDKINKFAEGGVVGMQHGGSISKLAQQSRQAFGLSSTMSGMSIEPMIVSAIQPVISQVVTQVAGSIKTGMEIWRTQASAAFNSAFIGNTASSQLLLTHEPAKPSTNITEAAVNRLPSGVPINVDKLGGASVGSRSKELVAIGAVQDTGRYKKTLQNLSDANTALDSMLLEESKNLDYKKGKKALDFARGISSVQTVGGRLVKPTDSSPHSYGPLLGRDIHNIDDRWMKTIDTAMGRAPKTNIKETFASGYQFKPETEYNVGGTGFATQLPKRFSMGNIGAAFKRTAFSPVGAIGVSMLGTQLSASENSFTKTAGGVLSGAAGGAMIGSMILPGWGTAIGAFIGGVTGAVSSLKDFSDNLKKAPIQEYTQRLAGFAGSGKAGAQAQLIEERDAIYELASKSFPQTKRKVAMPTYMGIPSTVYEEDIKITMDNWKEQVKTIEEHASKFENIDRKGIMERIRQVGPKQFKEFSTQESYESTLMALGSKSVDTSKLNLVGKTLEEAIIIWSDEAVKAGEKLLHATVINVEFKESLEGLVGVMEKVSEEVSFSVDKYKESGDRSRFLSQGVFGTGLQTNVSQASAIALRDLTSNEGVSALNSVNNWAFKPSLKWTNGEADLNYPLGKDKQELLTSLASQTDIIRWGLPSMLSAAKGGLTSSDSMETVMQQTFGQSAPQLVGPARRALEEVLGAGGGRGEILKEFTGDPVKITEEVMSKLSGGNLGKIYETINRERLEKAQYDINQYVDKLGNKRRIRETYGMAGEIGFRSSQEARQRQFARGEISSVALGRMGANVEDVRALGAILPEIKGAFGLGSLGAFGVNLQSQSAALAGNRQLAITNPAEYGKMQANLTDKTQRYMQVLQRLTQGTEQLNDAQRRLSELNQQEQSNKDFTLRYLSAEPGERAEMQRDFMRMQENLGVGFGNLAPYQQSQTLRTLQSQSEAFSFGGRTKAQLLTDIASDPRNMMMGTAGFMTQTTNERIQAETNVTDLEQNRQTAALMTAQMMENTVNKLAVMNSADQQQFQSEMAARIEATNQLFNLATIRFENAVKNIPQTLIYQSNVPHGPPRTPPQGPKAENVDVLNNQTQGDLPPALRGRMSVHERSRYNS